MLKWNRATKKALKSSFNYTCLFTIGLLAIGAWLLSFGYCWEHDHLLLLGVLLFIAVWAIAFGIELCSKEEGLPCKYAEHCNQFRSK